MAIFVFLMTAPGWIGLVNSVFGGISETYFCPNRVLGKIAPVTSGWILLTSSGNSPRVSSAPSAVGFMSMTSPTMSPRTLTSARSGSCRPILSALRVISSNSANLLVNWAQVRPSAARTRTMKTIPRTFPFCRPQASAAALCLRGAAVVWASSRASVCVIPPTSQSSWRPRSPWKASDRARRPPRCWCARPYRPRHRRLRGRRRRCSRGSSGSG